MKTTKEVHAFRIRIVRELDKFRERTRHYVQDYFGSDEQIKNETEILSVLLEVLDEDVVEMGDREDLVEWYQRMLMATRPLLNVQ